MKRFIVLISILCTLSVGMRAYAQGYNILVMPESLVGVSNKTDFGSVNIEEMLARKLVMYFETSDIAYAPTMSTLKISIKNNSNYIPNAVNPMNNAKIISKAYGVPKIILVSSKIELQNPSVQKMFWNKLDLPVLTQVEPNLRIITTIKFVNAQTDDVLWHNVYYKNVNSIGNGINNYMTADATISAINSYYDSLVKKVLEEIKDSKETSAIMLSVKPDALKSQPIIPVCKIQPEKKEKTVKNVIQKQPKQIVEEQPKVVKVKSDKSNKPKAEPITDKIGKYFDDKYAKLKQKQDDYKAKREEKLKQKAEKKVLKVADKALKEKEKTSKQLKMPVIKNNIVKVQESQTETEKINTQKSNRIKVEKPKKVKVVETKEPVEKKLNITDKIKSKYNEMKVNYQKRCELKKKHNEETSSDYSNIMWSEDDDMPVNNYMQTKPRNNSRNFVPQFDSTINDI